MDDPPAHALCHRRRRLALVFFACTSTFFYVGAFFGWGPMQLLLEENGAFDWKCSDTANSAATSNHLANSTNNNNINSSTTTTTTTTTTIEDPEEICSSRTNALINVQFIAQITQILSPLLGELADRYGAQMNVFLMTACMWSGLISLVLAARYRWDRLLYVAFIMIGLGAWNGALLTVQTARFFSSESVRRRIIVLLNSLFDAGSVTYLLLWKISQALFPTSSSEKQSQQQALTKIATGYFFISVLLFGALSYLWTVTEPEENKGKEEEEEDSVPLSPVTARASTPEKTEVGPSDTEILPAGNPSSSVITSSKFRPTTTTSSELTMKGASQGCAGPSQETTEHDTGSHDENYKEADSNKELEIGCEVISATPEESVTTTPSSSNTAHVARYIPIAERTPYQQLTSGPALLLAIFFPIHVTSYTWSITTTRDFLAYLGDDELDNKYLTIFTSIMPSALLALPLVDLTVSRFGYAGGFFAINLLALGYSVIRLASDNLNVQILGFILFAFYSCFLFGTVMSFLPVLLAPSITGKAAGFLYMLAGLFMLVNLPMANLATQHFDGDFFWPNLVYTLLLLPCMVAAWGLARAIHREKVAKAAAATEDL